MDSKEERSRSRTRISSSGTEWESGKTTASTFSLERPEEVGRGCCEGRCESCSKDVGADACYEDCGFLS